MDRRGIEPRLLGCKPSVFPLDQQPMYLSVVFTLAPSYLDQPKTSVRSAMQYLGYYFLTIFLLTTPILIFGTFTRRYEWARRFNGLFVSAYCTLALLAFLLLTRQYVATVVALTLGSLINVAIARRALR